MKKYIYILLLLFFSTYSHANNTNYKDMAKIEMEIFRNNEKIGYSNYFFEHENNTMTVKNYTQFKVKLFGATIFSISSEAIEKYKDNKLVYFKSITSQNNKEKYVDLNYDAAKKKYMIKGSSYTGEANLDCVIGNWWNNKLLEANKQISPLSGSIKDQVVTLINEETINLYSKNYLTTHYKLKSKDENISNNKKLDFDIWVDKKNNLILKVVYKRMGDWEYRVKSFH